MSYFVLGKVYWTFNLQAIFSFFKPSKCFIPRRDVCLQTPVGVLLFFAYELFGLGKVYWTFKIRSWNRLFETSAMFYPPKGTEGGPIVFTYVLFCVRKRILDFQFTGGFCLFETPRMFYLMGRVGRVGRVGRSRFVSFKFLHTLWVYRLSIYLLINEIKIVTNILMGFKIWCQVGGLGQKYQNYCM